MKNYGQSTLNMIKIVSTGYEEKMAPTSALFHHQPL